MKRYPPALLLAFALALCNMGAYRTSKLVVSLFAVSLGADPLDVGVIVSLYALVPLVIAVYAGRITDRLGMLRPMAAGTSGVVVGLIVPGLWPGLPALYLSAAILGGSYVFYHVAIQKLVGTISTPETRSQNFAGYSMVLAIATFLGPLVFGYAIDRVGHARTYLLLAAVPLTTLALLAAFRRLVPAHASEAGHHGGPVFDLLANRGLRRILLTSGVILTGIDLFSFYLPIYAHDIGLSATVIGRIMAMFALASFVVRVGMPRMVARYSEERVLAGSLAVAGGTYLLFPFFTDARVLGAIAFLLGLGLGCGQPLSTMLTYSRSPQGRTGEALGLRLTVNHFTHVVVPLVFGAIGMAFGLAPVFWTNAAFLAGGGWLSRRDS
jgi:MFS family permease